MVDSIRNLKSLDKVAIYNNSVANDFYCILYRKNLFMKEKNNRKDQHKLNTLFTITKVILLERQINLSTVAIY